MYVFNCSKWWSICRTIKCSGVTCLHSCRIYISDSNHILQKLPNTQMRASLFLWFRKWWHVCKTDTYIKDCVCLTVISNITFVRKNYLILMNTLTVEMVLIIWYLTKMLQFEYSFIWCWRRMEKISWIDHVRNEAVLLKSQVAEEYPTWNK
jgi:hypothetical protein